MGQKTGGGTENQGVGQENFSFCPGHFVTVCDTFVRMPMAFLSVGTVGQEILYFYKIKYNIEGGGGAEERGGGFSCPRPVFRPKQNRCRLSLKPGTGSHEA